MIVLPAIDIKNGQCVRLFQGDFNTAKQVAADPLEAALNFQKQGAQYLHMVDLDGAKDASLCNKDIFVEIAKKTDMCLEIGGGIRSSENVAYYLENGIDRVILGSVALKNPSLVRTLVSYYGKRIVVGIDAKDGMVSTEGWLDVSDVNYITLAMEMEAIGVKNIIFTDISKDGTLAGPNLEALQELNNAISCNIIASGGIKNINDIKAVKE
ncbi:MAG: 1-(5-phosphoribosyl)-5-[(5-phosphoribosylamino)methylideneamino]imidazole-4-carboxamide isomerase, partial [Oscillospiraceae bacterium]